MLKHVLVLVFMPFLLSEVRAQSIWTDTARTFVQLGEYNLGEKVVQADYGKVIMFFKQRDYLGKTSKNDTVNLSPRYFDDYRITALLKAGKARIIKRSIHEEVMEINHRLVQSGSMCYRKFEFSDGVLFWSTLEITGLIGAISFSFSDTLVRRDTVQIVQTKDFGSVHEEYPDMSQKISFRIREFFPDNTDMRYVFKECENRYNYLDTIGCKNAKVGDQEVFYFPFLGFSKYKLTNTKTTMFGEGAYFFRNDSLFTLHLNYEEDLMKDEFRKINLLIPAEMWVGDSVTIDFGVKKKTFTYLKNESVKVEDIVYDDCVKIKILTYWTETIYISYVWLKKDVGMVKWTRESGRFDVLVGNYSAVYGKKGFFSNASCIACKGWILFLSAVLI